MSEVKERIEQLRKLMAQAGIDVYYIPMSDCHNSEYVAKHFRCIEFISGFTGSAGHVIVTKDEAWLFADGRYYIQAENQLKGSDITLMKWGQPQIPEPVDFVTDMAAGKVLGFDGSVVNANFAKQITKKASKVVYNRDLVGEIWTDRPAQEFSKIWEVPIEACGETTESKLSRIRKELEKEIENSTIGIKNGSYGFFLNSLDDIAWIFNIRANDVPCNPVVFAFAVIGGGIAHLYTDGKGYCKEWYKNDEVAVDNVLMDLSRISYDTYRYFVDKGYKVIDIKNPSTLMKGIKNETEKACLKEALKRDSAVEIKFMKWLKENVGKIPMDEISVDEYLTGLRKESDMFLDRSFGTIAAYKENAAMMHYSATPQNFKEIKAEGMLLVDSGAQYKDGTTDITRTFVLGELTDEEKKAFTLTAVSMLRLLNAKFIEGCRGENVDICAREVMWRVGWDYKCGTGHGVGHILNVHEGPHNIRWNINAAGPSAVFKEGMVVTNEPGVYREGKFGIRTENEMIVVPYMETEDGKFLQFENLTFIPIDLDGIDTQYMNEEDKKLLNDYHKLVYETMVPYIDEDDKEWLKEYTREI